MTVKFPNNIFCLLVLYAYHAMSQSWSSFTFCVANVYINLMIIDYYHYAYHSIHISVCKAVRSLLILKYKNCYKTNFFPFSIGQRFFLKFKITLILNLNLFMQIFFLFAFYSSQVHCNKSTNYIEWNSPTSPVRDVVGLYFQNRTAKLIRFANDLVRCL